MEGEEFRRLMRAGDARAWDRLIPVVRQISLGACRDFRMPYERWDDHVQDVAYKVFVNWESYRGDSKLNTWIYSIARHVCIDEMRRARVRKEVTETGMGLDEGTSFLESVIDGAASDLDQMLCVQKIIAELDALPVTRKDSKRIVDVLRWCVENDPSSDELAVYFGTSTGAAKQRKSYMLQQFRKLCEQHCGDDECNFARRGGE